MLVAKKKRGFIHHNPKTYGHSQLGVPLEIYLPKDHSPKILLIAGIHGDEPETIVLLSEALRMTPVNQLQSAVILCANPHGSSHGTRANNRGVDLNRNFPSNNWSSDPVYYRNKIGEPQDIELKTGSKACSESETKALVEIIQKLNPSIVISLHSALACVEDPNQTELGKWLSKETKLPFIMDVGYPTPGSFGSWATEQNLPVITFELPAESITVMKSTIVPSLVKLMQNNWR